MPIISQKIKYIPEKGSIVNLFDRLNKYIIEIDTGWTNYIKPAKKENVELLKTISKIKEEGFDIPGSYKLFLEFMGEEDGGILSQYINADTSLTSICEYYKDEYAYRLESINPGILIFGLIDMGDELSFDLNINNEPRIIKTVDGEILNNYCENFEKLLFQGAFYKYEKLRFPFYLGYGGSQIMLKDSLEKNQTNNIFQIVGEYAKKENFTKAWFSDFRHYVGFRDNVSFMVEESEGCLTLVLYGNSEKIVNDIGDKLSFAIGVEKK